MRVVEMGRSLKLGLAAMLSAATLAAGCTNRADEEAILTAFEAVCADPSISVYGDISCSNARITCLVSAEVSPAEQMNGYTRKYALAVEWVISPRSSDAFVQHLDGSGLFVAALGPSGWVIVPSGPNNSCAY